MSDFKAKFDGVEFIDDEANIDMAGLIEAAGLHLNQRDTLQGRNTSRASHAAYAVREHARLNGEDAMDWNVRDLLTNLMHLSDALKLDWDYITHRASVDYRAEVTGRDGLG